MLTLFLLGCGNNMDVCDRYGCYDCEKEPRQMACIEKGIQELYEVCVEFTVIETWYDEHGEYKQNNLKLNRTEVKKYCSYVSLMARECYPRNPRDDYFEVYKFGCTKINESGKND